MYGDVPLWFATRVALTVDRFDDPGMFLARVGAFLGRREAEHNLLFGILDSLRADPTVSDGPPYLAAVRDGDAIVAAALQTPPRNLVFSETDDPAAIDTLVVDILASGRVLPGVLGPLELSRRFAERWTAATGAPHRLQISERAFRLSRVIPLRPVAGSMRVADLGDFDLLVAWLMAFAAEALPEESNDLEDARTSVNRWLRLGTKRTYLWERDGTPVSWTSVGGRTPNGTRVGPVYTPPEHRGHGYASALVAAASQAQLDDGLAFCFLFTDLANSTSNHIYQAIGYEPVTDIDVYVFG
jgi:predicted GNAT family acetyltransferase